MKTYWQYLRLRYLLGLFAITPLIALIYVEFWNTFFLFVILPVSVVVNIRSMSYAKARIPKIEAIIGCDYVTDDEDLVMAYTFRIQTRVYIATSAVLWLTILCFGQVKWRSDLFDFWWWLVALIIFILVMSYLRWRKYRAYYRQRF